MKVRLNDGTILWIGEELTTVDKTRVPVTDCSAPSSVDASSKC